MIIATRKLLLRTEHGDIDVPIALSAPKQISPQEWFCRYEIGWPDGKWEMSAYGVDSLQSLVLALQMIGSELYTSEHHRAGTLTGDDGTIGYGFPVTSSLRDELVGDDAKYF